MDKLNQVMLYVDDLESAVKFWTETLNFVIVQETEMPDNYKAVEVAPNENVETSITLFDKAFIKKYSPEVSTETPSLMFKETNFDALYDKLKALNLTGHDIIDMGGVRVFNFQDGQGNFFAVSE
ncbi:VOC family protein [Macrococcus capreoli]|uniref:VOC family protein n=1 Tax=Macrococcus capreoli TaxID=2982690 RepID=UPI0021D5BDB2|nr:VOC family protein [Macrococcus sp. TMW 2.2395]MCU7557876.1 VOC family protein [Macrococcus sp. TMW 2.2395]